MKVRCSLTMLVAVSAGCAPLAPSAPSGMYIAAKESGASEADPRIVNEGKLWKGGRVPWFYENADQYCKNLQVQASRGSTRYAELGWTIGIIGVVGTGASASATTATAPNGFSDAGWKVAMGATAGLGVVLGALGVYWLARSEAADKISSEAITAGGMTAQSETDKWKACLAVRSHWSEDNAQATNAAEKTIGNASSESYWDNPHDAGAD